MTDIHKQKTLALAAVFQAAALCDQLARRGQADPDALKVLLDSIVVFDTDNPNAIYGSAKNLKLGLRALENSLTDAGQNQPESAEPLRYALGLIHLEGQLNKSNALLHTLRQRLEQSQAQLAHFDHDILAQGMVNNFASIYVDTVGTLRFRLKIVGNQQRLETAGIPEKIRACLLAGIRGAWLWRRLGGRRWHLLFTRSQILTELRVLIREAQQS
ncbi:high frequency lysogenization protein HflD [Agitococcus lubricus]|uniref:High frequency lysogenization protein HflD homolog n=1 Tax=Agitococcus lubricus TaxID=1077255 RepID=A0A2T5IYV9_9GAMM|nr:high frequency lysogenization protein HflD [Agitococcus lubricus]PTQ89197.1 high frequency lysogenization protein [Agitococcus lubricus]